MSSFSLINEHIRSMGPQRAVKALISGSASHSDTRVAGRSGRSEMDLSGIPDVRTFEKNLRAKGYSNREAKRSASMYNKMKQHIEANRSSRDGELDSEDLEAIKDLAKTVKQSIQ